MPVEIPANYMDLITEKKVMPTLVTVMPDGQPQGSVVWFSYDNGYIWINSAKGRQKDKNMRARPMVTLVFVDPADPYRFVEVRGKVVEVTEEGGVDHANALSLHYDGKSDFFEGREERRKTETRVKYKIEPTRVVTH
jgi:PPOX class probable F420-dependent enzyme